MPRLHVEDVATRGLGRETAGGDHGGADPHGAALLPALARALELHALVVTAQGKVEVRAVFVVAAGQRHVADTERVVFQGVDAGHLGADTTADTHRSELAVVSPPPRLDYRDAVGRRAVRQAELIGAADRAWGLRSRRGRPTAERQPG